jgi:tRNA dimethylallyltransferase
MLRKPILLITGPTACGKTEIAIEITRQFHNAEILSVDSRQFYRYMDIGTAKPSAEQQLSALHHFIDISNPDQQLSAGEYARRARRKIEELWQREIIPIMVGGSGMYWKAVIDGFYEDNKDYSSIRKQLIERRNQEGLAALYLELEKVDPSRHFRIDQNDSQRILRALEVALVGGESIGLKWERAKGADWPCLSVMVWMDIEREQLYQRIDQRVDCMIEMGLVSEVEKLVQMGYGADTYSMGAMGYIEIIRYLEGQCSLDQATSEIKMNSRRFAKRQFTWFRRDRRLRRLDLGDWGRDGVIERIIEQYRHNTDACFLS